MYERGGIFSMEHGFFDFAVGSFPRGKWQQYEEIMPLLKLDTITIDRLDIDSGDGLNVINWTLEGDYTSSKRKLHQ